MLPTTCRASSTTTLIDWADVVVAACDGVCPVVPGKRNENWHLPDPMGLPLDEVRVIRDEIKRRVDTLLDELAPLALDERAADDPAERVRRVDRAQRHDVAALGAEPRRRDPVPRVTCRTTPSA